MNQSKSNFTKEKSVPFADGASWVGDAWEIFKLAPAPWIGLVIVFFIISVVLGLIPILGNIAFQFVYPMIIGGIMYTCKSLEDNGEMSMDSLTIGFREKLKEFLILGLMYFVFALLIVGILFLFVGGAALTGMPVPSAATSAMQMNEESLIVLLLAFCVAMFFGLLFVAATWFAPALIIFNDLSPLQAMKESFFACFRNFGAMFLYSIVITIVMLVSMISLGLGLLVSVPLLFITNYTSYKSIFEE